MKLVENLGNTDKVIRILISAVIVFLFATEFIGGLLAAGLLAFGAILSRPHSSVFVPCILC